jgi:hypothetical protein
MIRPSSAPRAVSCLHWLHHEPVDFRYLAPNKEDEGAAAATRGTLIHRLYSNGMLMAKPAEPCDTLAKEVPVAFDLTGANRPLVFPNPAHASFEAFVNDVRAMNPDHIIGHSDMLGLVDGVLYVCDLKTGKNVSPEAFYQVAMYGVIWCMQHGRQDLIATMKLSIWRLRYRGPDEAIYATQASTVNEMVYPETVGLDPAAVIAKVKDLIVDLMLPLDHWPANPGAHCKYCPARFTCASYGTNWIGIFTGVRQWMINEMLAYQQQFQVKETADE